jgi:nitrate reductase gamma subunit
MVEIGNIAEGPSNARRNQLLTVFRSAFSVNIIVVFVLSVALILPPCSSYRAVAVTLCQDSKSKTLPGYEFCFQETPTSQKSQRDTG